MTMFHVSLVMTTSSALSVGEIENASVTSGEFQLRGQHTLIGVEARSAFGVPANIGVTLERWVPASAVWASDGGVGSMPSETFSRVLSSLNIDGDPTLYRLRMHVQALTQPLAAGTGARLELMVIDKL